jgi:hypothetical protein
METIHVLIHHASVKQLGCALVAQNVAVRQTENNQYSISNFYFKI